MKVYLILAWLDGKWHRVGRIYRSKEAARSWAPWVRSAWRARTKVKTVTIGVVDGKPTESSVRLFDEVYNCDLT